MSVYILTNEFKENRWYYIGKDIPVLSNEARARNRLALDIQIKKYLRDNICERERAITLYKYLLEVINSYHPECIMLRYNGANYATYSIKYEMSVESIPKCEDAKVYIYNRTDKDNVTRELVNDMNNKKNNKMVDNTQKDFTKINIMIDEWYNDQEEDIRKDYNEFIESEILANSKIRRVAKDFINLINKECRCELSIGDIYVGGNTADKLLTVDESKKIEEAKKMLENTIKDIERDKRELKALISITDTYNQVEKLLKKYGVCEKEVK